jgi:flagellar export protein FliJ
VTRWPLQALLDLRRRAERAETAALAAALGRWRASSEATASLRRQVAELDRGAGWAGAIGPVGSLASLAVWASRLQVMASAAETRSRTEAERVTTRRARLREAALRREAVERLRTAWTAARALEAARRIERAQDDRPWHAGPR